MILAIKTDSSLTEISLYELDSGGQLASKQWESGRELSVQIHRVIADLPASVGADLKGVEGIVCFVGPGSFTGLRIGLTVANTLAYSLGIPIVGSSSQDWLQEGLLKIKDGVDSKVVTPEYGGEANITKPRK